MYKTCHVFSPFSAYFFPHDIIAEKSLFSYEFLNGHSKLQWLHTHTCNYRASYPGLPHLTCTCRLYPTTEFCQQLHVHVWEKIWVGRPAWVQGCTRTHTYTHTCRHTHTHTHTHTCRHTHTCTHIYTCKLYSHPKKYSPPWYTCIPTSLQAPSWWWWWRWSPWGLT